MGRMTIGLALALVLMPMIACAQGNLVQGGSVTPGHAARWVTNGVLGDGGGAGGSTTQGSGYLTELGITNSGTPVCINDALISAPGGYHAFCFGANSLTPDGALISYQAYGGALPLPVNCNINGRFIPNCLGFSGSITGLTAVPNLGALEAAPSSASPVYREGFSTPGDGGSAFYNYSSSPCSIGSGGGDGGAQVIANGGGCWIANFAGQIPTPLVWGAAGNGTANDSVPVQAAISALQGTGIPLGLSVGIYKLNTGVTTSAPITLLGGGGRGIYVPTCSAGLRYGTANLTLLTVGATIDIEHLCIDNGSVTNTSGTGISSVNDTSSGSKIRDSQINNACIGIDLSGNASGQNAESIIDGNAILPANSSGCIGIRIGVQTTAGNTPDTRITNNSIFCSLGGGSGTQIAMLFLDSGGPFVENNSPYGCGIGTYIHPGVNQLVQFGFFVNTILGDSDSTNNLLIDTADVSAAVFNNKFTSTWASTAFGGSSVLIKNTAAGSVTGLHFVNHQSLPFTNQIGMQIGGTNDMFDILIEGGLICGKTGTTDIKVTAGYDINIINNTIGSCNGSTSGPGASSVGIDVESVNHFNGIITGNNISGAVTPLIWNPADGGASSGVFISQNLGIDNIQGTVTSSAASIALPVNSVVLVTDTTPITTMNGEWGSRQVTLIAGTGGLTFATGGNILNGLTAAAGTLVDAIYVGGSGWRLK